MAELFLDTSYAIALSSPPDQYHERALALARQIEAQKRRLVTTRAVVLEIGNALAKQRYRAAARLGAAPHMAAPAHSHVTPRAHLPIPLALHYDSCR